MLQQNRGGVEQLHKENAPLAMEQCEVRVQRRMWRLSDWDMDGPCDCVFRLCNATEVDSDTFNWGISSCIWRWAGFLEGAGDS